MLFRSEGACYDRGGGDVEEGGEEGRMEGEEDRQSVAEGVGVRGSALDLASGDLLCTSFTLARNWRTGT